MVYTLYANYFTAHMEDPISKLDRASESLCEKLHYVQLLYILVEDSNNKTVMEPYPINVANTTKVFSYMGFFYLV